MPPGDLVRIVPILTARDLSPEVAFYEWLGLSIMGDYGDYLVLATDAVSEDAAEVHLSHWAEHDRRNAGSVYLRVRDAADLHHRLRDDLNAGGRLFEVPPSGLAGAVARELRAREDAGEDLVPLTGVGDKPWGMHEFGIIDPAGWLVRVGSPAPS